jgi:hypothetical protein
MDLSLATPELDHGALREIISPYSTTIRDEGYSPPPTGTWQLVFSTPSKEVCTSTFSVTHQPHLSSCSQTLPMSSYRHIELNAQHFPLHSRVEVCFPFLPGRVFSLLSYLVYSYLSPNYLLSFLPQQGCVGLNPNSWSSVEAL